MILVLMGLLVMVELNAVMVSAAVQCDMVREDSFSGSGGDQPES